MTRALVLALALAAGQLRAAPDPNAADNSRKAINLEALGRLKGMDLEANPTVKAVVLKILDQVRGTPQFLEIVRDFNIKGQDGSLMELAAKDPSGPTGAEAMRLVLRDEDLSSLHAGLDGTNAAGLIEALGNTGEKDIVPLLKPLVTDLSRPTGLRKTAVQALAKVQEGAAALIDLARDQKLPDDLRLTASMELNNVRWEPLKEQAAQLLPPLKTQSAHPLPPIAELVKLKADPQKGAAVFRRDTVGASNATR